MRKLQETGLAFVFIYDDTDLDDQSQGKGS